MVQKETITKSGIGEGVSVIIPAYNAAEWLEPTTNKIDEALIRAKIKDAEIIIIDDGSSDGTYTTAQKLEASVPVHALTQPNQGRFLTRKRGVRIAKYPTIFFVDTRVWIDNNSLKYVLEQQHQHPERLVWNGDVEVHKKGNVIARFGDAVTRIGWRRYHGNPRLLSYDITDFDHYPKGTGIFIAPKSLLTQAIRWFESQTKDIKNSSDDTLLIRYIAERERIWISPGFTSLYFARTTLKGFIGHTYHRGMFFVDGFLRPGTRFYYPLVGFLAISFISVITLIFIPAVIPFALIILSMLWVLELLTALCLRIGAKDSLSLFLLTPVFALFYGLGIWRAFIYRIVKKK